MIMPAAEGGGQVKKKYLDKSMTAYLMHTKLCVLLSSFTLSWLASLCLAVCDYLTCLSECQLQVAHRICFGFAMVLSEVWQLVLSCPVYFGHVIKISNKAKDIGVQVF